MITTSTWPLFGMVLGSSMFWLQYVDLKDHIRPEPRRRLIAAFVLGLAACSVAYVIFTALEGLGVPSLDSGSVGWTAVFCLLFIGPIEEAVKVLAAYLFVFRWREFDEPIDGFVYASAIGLGFASLENMYQLPDLPVWEQLARSAVLPLTHSLFAAIWGFGIAHGRLSVRRGARRRVWEIGSIALAIFLHGLYDFVLFAYQATWLTSGLILIIWICVIQRARMLVRSGDPAARPSNARVGATTEVQLEAK